MLETLLHKDNCFITLTYDDKHLPTGGSLAPEEIRNWLKRFRKAIEPVRIRYYVTGEYGDKNGRPHYHAAVFGYPRCRFGLSRYREGRKDCCDYCDTVRDTWERGRVDVGSLEVKSAQYVAGYVTKKMTRFDDPRLKGRHPEFSRMSLKPGIGADAMHDVASVFLQFGLASQQGDVPSSLMHGKRLLPLGRYLRGKLREYCGLAPGAPPETVEAMAEEVRALLESQGIDTAFLKGEAKKVVIQNALQDASAQHVLNILARRAIFEKREL